MTEHIKNLAKFQEDKAEELLRVIAEVLNSMPRQSGKTTVWNFVKQEVDNNKNYQYH